MDDGLRDLPAEGIERMRADLLRRFDAWLGGVLSAEDPPQGAAAELLAELLHEDSGGDAAVDDAADRYAVWSALTALTQEIKLQGRAFRDLDDTLRPVNELGPAIQEALAAHEEAVNDTRRLAEAAYRDREQRDQEIRRETERRVRADMLSTLVDVHERLRRGLDTAEDPVSPRGVRRWFGSHEHDEKLRALALGYRLGLEHLEERLARWGVRPLPALNAPFDPAWMNAVDVVETAGVPEGTVVEVYRAGYEWNGEILRAAQVKVARAPRPNREG